MDTILKTTINEQLNILYTNLNYQLKRMDELKPFENAILHASNHVGGKTYYYKKEKGDKKQQYLRCDSAEIGFIKEMQFLKLSTCILQKNIETLEKVLSDYQSFDQNEIIRQLPKTYQEGFTELIRLGSLNKVYVPSKDIAAKTAAWKAEKEKFKEEFNRIYPDRFADRKRVQASDGTYMRSKSEVQIAELAKSYGITAIYELPHYCNGQWIRSDFTFLSPIDAETEHIHEHVGMLDDRNYQEKHFHNQIKYMEEGYKPNINLFQSYDYFDGSFSLIPMSRIFDQIKTSVPPKSFIKRLHEDDAKVLAMEVQARAEAESRRHSLFK